MSELENVTPFEDRRYSSDDSKPPRGSPTRRISLTKGLKDGGRNVATAVGTLFKYRRGEQFDPEDDPESVKGFPTWEEDLKKYLPEHENYHSPGTRVSPTGDIPVQSGNVASSSSHPPMVPTEDPNDAALSAAKKVPQSLAAYRWHKAYSFVKRQNALKKKALGSPIGTGAKMQGHSLGLVPLGDEFRTSLFHFWYNEYPSTEYKTFVRNADC